MSSQHYIANTADGITFSVDANLPPSEEEYELSEARENVETLLHDVTKLNKKYLTSSFEGQRFYYAGQDSLYQSFVRAYADHRPLILSPDMIWLIISQVFAQYVKDNAEELRDNLVNHQVGKLELVIESKQSLLSDQVDWPSVMDHISNLIKNNTKNNIADVILSDFSTTTSVERLASQITLMKVTEPYFVIRVVHMICGIPYITLKGTPTDWQLVYDKTMALAEYGLEEWIDRLKPILQQFVNASNGNVDRFFWQNVVKKRRPKQMVYQGCGYNKYATRFNGWFLNFFSVGNNFTLKLK